eukprot:tig00000459_g1107.t1
MDALGSFLAASVAASQLAGTLGFEQHRLPFDYWPPLEPYAPPMQHFQQQLSPPQFAERGSPAPATNEGCIPTRSQIQDALNEHLAEIRDSSSAFSWFLNNDLPRALTEKVLCFSIPKEARFPPPKDDRTGGYGVLFRKLGFSQPEVAQRKWHRWRASIGYPWEEFRGILAEMQISFPPTLPPRKPGEENAPRPRGRPPMHKNKEKKAAAAAVRATPPEQDFDMYAPDRSLRPRVAGMTFDGLDSEGEDDASHDAGYAGHAESRSGGGPGRKRTTTANPAAYRKQGPPVEGSPRQLGNDVPQDVIQHYLTYLKQRAEAMASNPGSQPVPHEEAYCLVCKDAECELKCDFPGCTKVYHVDCLVPEARPGRLESGDYDLDSNWYCPRHKCGHCSKIEELNRCDACLWCFCKRHGAQPQDQALPGSAFTRKMCARCRNLVMGYPVDDESGHQRSRVKGHPAGKAVSPQNGPQGPGAPVPEIPQASGPRSGAGARRHDLTIRVTGGTGRSYSPSGAGGGRGRGRGAHAGLHGRHRRGSGHTASPSESDETETDVDLDSDEEAAFPAPGAVANPRRSGGVAIPAVPRIRAFEEVAAASSPRDFAASPRTITVGAAVAALSVHSPRALPAVTGRDSPRTSAGSGPGPGPGVGQSSHHHHLHSHSHSHPHPHPAGGPQAQSVSSPSTAKRKFHPSAAAAPPPPRPRPGPDARPRPRGPHRPRGSRPRAGAAGGDLPSAFLPPPSANAASGAGGPGQHHQSVSLAEQLAEGDEMDSPPPQLSTAGSSNMTTPLSGGQKAPSGATLPPLLSSARGAAAAAHSQHLHSPKSTVVGASENGAPSEASEADAAAEEASKARDHFVGMLDWVKRAAADAAADPAARAALTRCVMLNLPQVQAVYKMSRDGSRRAPALVAALVEVAAARGFALPPAAVAPPESIAACLAWVEALAEQHPATIGAPQSLARLREHVFCHTPQVYALHAVRSRQHDGGAEALAILSELPLPGPGACEGPLCARCHAAIKEERRERAASDASGEEAAVDIEGQAPMDDG